MNTNYWVYIAGGISIYIPGLVLSFMFMSKSLEKFEEGTYEDSLDLDVNVVVLQAIPPWKWLKTLLVIGMIFLWPVYLVLVTIVLVIMLVFWYIPTEVWTNGKKISRLLRR